MGSMDRDTARHLGGEEPPETCGAVPPPGLYPRGIHVEPCKLAPGHDGGHRPGNEEEL